ncbi:extracellular solute-binding protein [Metabacillus endolithicus]|uniref:extracellular solute-binding protein n=1 Tax=Metabacillus endolithicus TaxID=1535204 RepID=UPI0031EE7E94
MKKRLFTFLSLLLVIASLSACMGKDTSSTEPNETKSTSEENIDPLGSFSEPVEISIGRGIDPNYQFDGEDTPENNVYTRWLEDQYNIVTKHEWEATAGEDYEQKVSLSIASNDIPDAMVVNETQLKQMIKAGQLADLTDVYDKYGAERLKDIYDSNPGLIRQCYLRWKIIRFT